MTYPTPSGHGDKDRATTTSREAAGRNVDAKSARRADILERLRAAGARGMTCEELCAARGGEAVTVVRPRVSDLHRDGLIENSGEKRRSEQGGLSAVWIAVD